MIWKGYENEDNSGKSILYGVIFIFYDEYRGNMQFQLILQYVEPKNTQKGSIFEGNFKTIKYE